MGVLALPVENLDAAVHMLLLDIDASSFQQVQQNLFSHIAEIPGDDPVVVIRLPPEIF